MEERGGEGRADGERCRGGVRLSEEGIGEIDMKIEGEVRESRFAHPPPPHVAPRDTHAGQSRADS